VKKVVKSYPEEVVFKWGPGKTLEWCAVLQKTCHCWHMSEPHLGKGFPLSSR
jgi:hypothetical protein